MGAYVYYSYEQFGRGYIGARKRSPVGDDDYFGSFVDPDFNPTEKVVIAEFDTYEEALDAEQQLHVFFSVVKSEHFANRSDGRGETFTWTEEARGRQRKNRLGKKWSDEVRQKMSDSAKTRGYSEKRAEKMRGNEWTKGKYWATDGTNCRMLNPDEPLPEGWRRGRPYAPRKKRNRG